MVLVFRLSFQVVILQRVLSRMHIVYILYFNKNNNQQFLYLVNSLFICIISKQQKYKSKSIKNFSLFLHVDRMYLFRLFQLVEFIPVELLCIFCIKVSINLQQIIQQYNIIQYYKQITYQYKQKKEVYNMIYNRIIQYNTIQYIYIQITYYIIQYICIQESYYKQYYSILQHNIYSYNLAGSQGVFKLGGSCQEFGSIILSNLQRLRFEHKTTIRAPLPAMLCKKCGRQIWRQGGARLQH
eukprot:TRINITY_DN4693_c0_g1_i2.p3 TRINITY_DN4693_c0_g1~~TRINITY_DN4693_c0_g1_i2.p3  ORF type:complete len:240 (-),score=-15.61 TRINITY_DN4693_c0_g1_i2:800-1519(-)